MFSDSHTTIQWLPFEHFSQCNSGQRPVIRGIAPSCALPSVADMGPGTFLLDLGLWKPQAVKQDKRCDEKNQQNNILFLMRSMICLLSQ